MEPIISQKILGLLKKSIAWDLHLVNCISFFFFYQKHNSGTCKKNTKAILLWDPQIVREKKC